MTVAVIVPARNEEVRLGQCLESVREGLLEADVRAAEVIVVDDDSNDRTAAIATAFGAQVMHQRPRRGPLAAWDRAAKSTTADILILVDGDCELETGALPAMLKHFTRSDVGVVAAHALPLKSGLRAGLVERSAWFSALVLNEIKLRLTDHDFLPIGRLMAVRRAAWRVERTDCAPCDRAVAHWVKAAGWSVVYEPDALVRYEPLQTIIELRADFRRTATSRQLEFDCDPLARLVQARAFVVASAKAPLNSAAWMLCRFKFLSEKLFCGVRPEPSKFVSWDTPVGSNYCQHARRQNLDSPSFVDEMLSVALVSKYDPGGIGGIENHLKVLLSGKASDRFCYVPITWLGGPQDSTRIDRYRLFIARLRCSDAQIVHFHGFDRLLLLVTLGLTSASTPFVITPHNGVAGALLDDSFLRRRIKIASDWFLVRVIINRRGNIVALNDAEREYYLERFPACDGLVSVLPNPVDEEAWVPLRSSGSPIRLLVIARLSKEKRIQDLIRAMALLPQSVICDIAGPDQGVEAELRSQAGRLDRTILFHGPVYGAVKERLLQQATAVVVSSNAEGLSTVALEALARGIPVIASDGGAHGLPKVGVYRYRTGCPKDLARAVQSLLSGDHLIDARRAARIASRSLLSREEYMTALLAVYQASCDSQVACLKQAQVIKSFIGRLLCKSTSRQDNEQSSS